MEKLIQKKRRVLYRRRFVFVLTVLITLAAVPAGTGCKQSVKGGSSGTQKDGSSSDGGQTQPEKPSELTLTIRGDERIDISAPDSISIEPNQTWKAVKERIASKAALKSGQDQAEYRICQWRLKNENGKILTDGYVFTKNETVYALTSYTNAKWKTEGSKLIGYKGDKPRGNIIIPDEINGSTITEIGKEALTGCDFDRVSLPESIRIIGEEAFYYCKSLQRIDMPDGLHTIGPRAFFGCIKLQGALRLPASLTMLDIYAFAGCDITEVNLSDCTQLKKIKNLVFSGCKNLKTSRFPAGLESVGNGAFSGCVKARMFDFSLCTDTNFGESTFTECSSARFKVKRGSKIKEALLSSCYIGSGRKQKIASWQIEEVD